MSFFKKLFGAKETQNESQQEPIIENEVEVKQEVQEDKTGLFNRLKQGLDKTRKNILGGVESVLKSFTKIDEELFEELEEALIMADIGVNTTMSLIETLKDKVKKEKLTDPQDIKRLLVEEITALLQDEEDREVDETGPMILLIVGVNGVGKTTTIGKLGHMFKQKKKSVMLAAGDTFRAAAIDQLEIWGERIGVDVIKQQEGADPAAVIYDAIQAAKARKTDVLICDTAGRLHNKKNLMEELKKVFRVVEREYAQARKEVILVLDATTGQNALQQAKLFKEVCDLTGIVLTKLDGTAKGGIILSIRSELDIPVYFIGVGEGMQDLQPFDAKEFASALFFEEK